MSSEDLLLPLPPEDQPAWRAVPFSPQINLETVDALRPARAPYINDDPQAPALVLVPGLGMDARGWRCQLQLAKLVDVHTLQAVNEAVAGEEAFGTFARHIEEYIIENKLEARPGGFVLGGCSMGGAVSIAIVARGRVKPRALVLIGSFANCLHLPWWQRFLAPLSWYLPWEFGKRVAGFFLRKNRELSPFRADLALMNEARAGKSRTYYGRAVMALTRQQQIALCKKFALPTLVVHGTKDWVLPHAAGVEMAEAIPGAKFVSVDGAGHIFFATHPEAVNAAIADFLVSLKS